MNENHARHLLATFRHIDGLLSELEHVLATAGPTSPFAEYTQDSTPVQRKVVHDYVEHVRQAMCHAMNDLGLPRPAPVCGAVWAASGQLNFAHIAVAEIEPQRLLGYGPLREEDTKAIAGAAAQLNAAVERLMAYLSKGPDADLPARLQRLEQTGKEVTLLRELERVISAQGLVEFRGALALVLDRMENGSFEIGVFGRVSSGKSSLLNHLLGMEVLPVGVTPVTAIPTRVRHGPKPRAVIEFAESKPVEIELARLAEFSTEQQNPGNARHVTRIQVELPSPRFSEGVTFVDTPGLGSLATSGAEETVAYLPRCDLGLVLVDAASTLTHEDLATVQALGQAGARAIVLSSKADLLRPPERQETLAYAQRQIKAQLGLEVPVRLVSVMGTEARLCDEWFERELKPLMENHREQAVLSLKRKTGGLREAVVNTLEARLHGQIASPTAASGEQLAEAATLLRKADALVEAAESEATGLLDQMPDLDDALLIVAAGEIAAAWRQHRLPGEQSGALCAAALGRAVSHYTAKLVERVESLRGQLQQTLAEAHRAVGTRAAAPEPLPRPASLPVFDPGVLAPKLGLQPPRLLGLLGTDLLRRRARSRLHRQAGAALRLSLSGYRRRLSLWQGQTLAGLRNTFHAQAGPLRAQLESRGSASADESSVASLEADLRQLQEWQA